MNKSTKVLLMIKKPVPLISESFTNSVPTTLQDTSVAADAGDYIYNSTFARWAFDTDALEMSVVAWATLYNSYPLWSYIEVRINGEHFSNLMCTALGSNSFDPVSLPAGNKRVELVSGINVAGSGTFLKSVTFSRATNIDIVPIATPANRLAIFGDSIAVGANATYPTHQGWGGILRQSIPVAFEAMGGLTLSDFASNETRIGWFTTRMSVYSPARLWSAIGTNDYYFASWTASAFGAGYGALLDAVHGILPDLEIYCQSPIVRSDEGANSLGNTLQDYRDAIQTVATARSSYCTFVDGTGAAFPQLADLADGLHPNTAGHAKYADAVKAILGI